MPKSLFIDFKAVKAAVRMEQLLEHYGLTDRFKKSGDSLSGPCPIHKGSNPTQFRVSISKNIWNCFSECKNGGNVLDFIAQMENVSIHAAALKAIEWFRLDGQTLTRSSRAESDDDTGAETEKPKATTTPKRETEKAEPNKALKFRLEKLEREHPFLAERGLSKETIEAFGVGFCAKGMMAGRIAIPIANDRSEVVAYVGRFPGEPSEDTPKYKLPPGFRKSLELFNIDRVMKEPADLPLVIVEGFFDCMSLHQNGCRKVVGLMGTSLSAEQENLILRHTSDNAHVVIILDEDEAGRAARTEIAARLALHRFVRVHRFASEGQQPCNLDADAVAKLLAYGLNP